MTIRVSGIRRGDGSLEVYATVNGTLDAWGWSDPVRDFPYDVDVTDLDKTCPPEWQAVYKTAATQALNDLVDELIERFSEQQREIQGLLMRYGNG